MGHHDCLDSELRTLVSELRAKLQDLPAFEEHGAGELPSVDQILSLIQRRAAAGGDGSGGGRAALMRLSELHERLHVIVESVPDGILSIGEDGTVQTANRAAGEVFGVRPTQLVGRRFHDLVHAVADGEEGMQAAAGTGEPVEAEAVRQDGSTAPVELRMCRGEEEHAGLRIAILRDLTERKESEQMQWRLEEDLRRAQKLEAVGQLAAGIAHEINTPTQFISDNTSFVRDAFEAIGPVIQHCEKLVSCPEEERTALIEALGALMEETNAGFMAEEVPEAIEETLQGIARVTRIVSAMRQFSHPGSTEVESADINQAIQSTTVVSTNVWKYVAELETDLDPDLPSVPCHLAEINQVVLNLIVNASHAIGDVVADGEKGKITVGTRLDGDHVEITVRDTGTGIPPEIVDRIFDPFFTTKEVGKGTGQGLSLAHSTIVDRHHGTIDVETEPGKGTCFHVRLPLVHQADAPKGVPEGHGEE